MNLQLQDQHFIVGGATSGLGKAVVEALLAEGAHVTAIARTQEKLLELQHHHPLKVEIFVGDITKPGAIQDLKKQMGNRVVHGLLVNAGGPPAVTALESTLAQWDEAYKNVFRWKVELMQAVLPAMMAAQYGRVVLVESASVKQPMQNLVLSTSMRLASVGYAKTLANELASQGITINVLAPGYHGTQAMERLFAKKSEQEAIELAEAKQAYVNQIPAGSLGSPADFGSLATWLLSPSSRFVTGQTISVDGGWIQGVFS